MWEKLWLGSRILSAHNTLIHEQETGSSSYRHGHVNQLCAYDVEIRLFLLQLFAFWSEDTHQSPEGVNDSSVRDERIEEVHQSVWEFRETCWELRNILFPTAKAWHSLYWGSGKRKLVPHSCSCARRPHVWEIFSVPTQWSCLFEERERQSHGCHFMKWNPYHHPLFSRAVLVHRTRDTMSLSLFSFQGIDVKVILRRYCSPFMVCAPCVLYYPACFLSILILQGNVLHAGNMYSILTLLLTYDSIVEVLRDWNVRLDNRLVEQ